MHATKLLTAALLTAALSLPAWAALPTGTLSFVQRTGTVMANETIPVVVTLTLDPDSAPLSFSSNPLQGFLPEDIPTQGQFWNPDLNQYEYRDFVEVFAAFLNTYFSCQGNFTDSCISGSNYNFQFNIPGSPEHPSINFLDSFTLGAGESFTYTFGFFVPQGGGAAPGVYRWNGTGVTLNFYGFDADGNQGEAWSVMDINTGFSLDPELAFERTVIAIPEPQTYALMALGLLAIGKVVRRRHRTR